MDYFWTDIAASYLPSAGKIVAPYSRDYDFLHGKGPLDAWLEAEGWGSSISEKEYTVENAFVDDNLRPGGYHPSSRLTALFRSGSREVTSMWTQNPVQQRWVWIGNAVSVGCTSGSFGPQDKFFGATFSGLDTVQASVFGDVYDEPYGVVRTADAVGHLKAGHLGTAPVCIEKGGTALLTMEVQLPRVAIPNQKNITLNILLPAAGTVRVDGADVDVSHPQIHAVAGSSVVTATLGGATVGFRLLHADEVDGMRPSVALASDEVGLRNGAVRLRMLLSPSSQPTGTRYCHVAFLVVAADDGSGTSVLERLRPARGAKSRLLH